jgi:HEAT repeat protein
MNASELILCINESDEVTVGRAINQLAESYRRGESLRSLIPLLEHTDSRVVSSAVWIVSEVADETRGRELFSQLAALLDHRDPAVRFGVIESIALLVKPEEDTVIRRLCSLAADTNSGVRQQALYWLCRIPESLVEALRGSSMWQSARLLLNDATTDDIQAAVKSKDLFDQRMGVAGAVRKLGKENSVLQEILPDLDSEVMASLSRLRSA